MKQIKLREDDTLYVLGDVIDRHPGGVQILREIMSMPNAKMLLGNHEYMMLNALAPYDKADLEAEHDHQKKLRLWYRNGGDITHHYFKHNRKETQAKIIEYLKTLPLRYDVEVNGKKYVLVHAAPEEFYESHGRDYKTAKDFAVWKRWDEYIPSPKGSVMIFGHTPTIQYRFTDKVEIWKMENVIDIDCGSGFPDGIDPWYGISGRLACLRLDDMKEFYSE
ncbi:MAG: metallophosphoesterase [Lachnospiraceae bacterium]|nr:metallophosphoesterase [Lachnospiraceae bacterium]